MHLTPLDQKIQTKTFIGFDVETYGQDNLFWCCSFVGDGIKEIFFSVEETIEYIKSLKDVVFVATNLAFDFFTIFPKNTHKPFKWIWRGSDLISIKTYLHSDGSMRNKYRHNKRNALRSIEFIDTMNYAPFSVAKMGSILQLQKLKTPSFIGELPRNDHQKEEMVEYNFRDSEISYKMMKFYQDGFLSLGANFKHTIASTAMSLFRNRFLDRIIYRHKREDIYDIMKAYYGGRTETFSRGLIKNYNYYDINSLYPSVMIKAMPNPNTLRRNSRNTLEYINTYEGFSEVDIYCPYMKYPLLPVRTTEDKLLPDGKKQAKLIFPTGNFSGWYSHVELRRAMELGYKIKKVKDCIYYKETFYPFVKYVNFLYSRRLKYKKEGSPMELIVKLLLNSLYGKFGQRFDDILKVEPMNLTHEELMKLDEFEIIGNGQYIRHKITKGRVPLFCFPELSAYTTAYGRIDLHSYMIKCDPVYVDTDSVITKNTLETGDKLGEMKLEMSVDEGIIIKPKAYLVKSPDFTMVKFKGVGMKIDEHWLKTKLQGGSQELSVNYFKFSKFKESVSRKIPINRKIDMIKNLNLTDTKRKWKNKKIDWNSLEESEPYCLDGLDIGGTTKNEYINTITPKSKVNTEIPIIQSTKV